MNAVGTAPSLPLIRPEWPVPSCVHAVTTYRHGGVSGGEYASLNLATHVGDDPGAVQENRRRLSAAAGLPNEPCWLTQVHGYRVLRAEEVCAPVEADGVVTTRPGIVCAVLTADCLPVLLADRAGQCIAAVHAGWRGLLAGVIPAAIAAMELAPARLIAWLGPAISQHAYPVGPELRDRFLARDPRHVAAFETIGGKLHLDLAALCRLELLAGDVTDLYDCRRCTYAEPENFYSWRRDGRTGRMASLIWIA